MDTLGHQVYAFLITILTGFSFGLLFDLYRVMRGAFRPRHYMTVVMDILFWIVTTPVLIIQLLVANWLELRFYVFLGVSLGLFLYFAVFSPLVLAVVISIGRMISQVAVLTVQGVGVVVMGPINLLRRIGLRMRWGRPTSGTALKVRPPMRWRSGLFGRWFRPR